MFRIVHARVVIRVVVVILAATLGVATLGEGRSKPLGASPVAGTELVDTLAASLTINGTMDDHGATYGFSLTANESATQAGHGGVTLYLNGQGLSLCTVHGPGADPDSFPLTQMQCGGAGGQAVSITGCRAEIEAHGYSHSDDPLAANYLGPVTLDVRFQKKGPNSGDLRVTVYTPKRPVTVEGPVTFNGPLAMSTCP